MTMLTPPALRVTREDCPVRRDLPGPGRVHFLVWNKAHGWVCNFCSESLEELANA